MNDRQEQILSLVSRGDEVLVNDLSRDLGVSLVTIRSDLRLLEEQNLLIRTRGGASLPPTDDISRRLSINHAVKQRIAAAAAVSIRPGETVFLEAGSTVSLLARELIYQSDIKVITNNAYVARQLKDAAGVRVIMLGGAYQKESESMVGPMVREYLRYYNYTKLFLGMDGFTPEGGFMSRDPDRAEVMGEFVDRAEEVFFVSDSSKFGRKSVRTICPASAVHHVVTDSSLESSWTRRLEAQGINVLTC